MADINRIKGSSGMAGKKKGDTVYIYVFLFIAGAAAFFPVYLTVMTAFKPVNELFIFPPKIYTLSPTADNFREMYEFLQNLWVPFSRYLFNTVFVTVTVTASQCFFCSMAGFVLAKGRFPGRKLINSAIVITLLYQSNVIYLMQYMVISKLHMLDTYFALILPSAVTPLGLFLMRQSISRIPDSMIEAAKIDGAGMFSVYRYIVMPNQKPALMTLIIFAFQNAWNSDSGNFVRSESLKTLSYAVKQAGNSGLARTGAAMAGSVVILIPPVIIFMAVQKNVMETMSYSGIKE